MAEPMDVIHPEPVWRERADFIISAPLLLEEGRAEQLSAWHEEDHLFEICCIPFFVFDVALGDVVETNARHDIVDAPAAFARITEIGRERRCEPEQVQEAKAEDDGRDEIRVRSPS